MYYLVLCTSFRSGGLKNKLHAGLIVFTLSLFFSLFAFGVRAQSTSSSKTGTSQNALAEATAAAGEPARGVTLRYKGLTFLYEDAGNVFYLMDKSVKPFQDSGFTFSFDVRRDYKIEDKNNPEDVGLREHFLVMCDKGTISSPSVLHLRGDSMLGKLKPPDFNKGMYRPDTSSYEYKALTFVCTSRLGDKYKVPTAKEHTPAPAAAAPTPTPPKDQIDKKLATKESPPISQMDISKLTVVFQPDLDPYYPSFSKRAGEMGEVVVRLIVGEDGRVEETRLLLSSNFPRLDRAAMEIGKRYIFEPFLLNGKPTKVSTNILVKFNLVNREQKDTKP
jgi:TonB family protein